VLEAAPLLRAEGERRVKSMMSFHIECVRNYLIEHGFVYTVRAARFDYPPTVEVKGIGKCRATQLFDYEVTKKEDLLWPARAGHGAEYSGFTTIDEWWATIQAFNTVPGKLWLVERIE
jgi:hypothetical protein